MASQVKGQVIYERTYPDAFPSMEHPIELSDFSTVSFANNSPCYFARWRHISSSGSIINKGGIASESTHSLRTNQIASDSILISCRVGPLDFDGNNYFQVLLWTPIDMTTLVLDTVSYYYWEDNEGSDIPVHYEAYLLEDDHVLYQMGDTVFSKNILTGITDFQETFFYIGSIFPVKDGLMIFSEGLPPTYFNSQIEPVKTWINMANHPFSFSSIVVIDSFLVGRNFNVSTALYAVNAFNENSLDIDLSSYLSKIEYLEVRGDILIVIGWKGALRYALQLNRNFEVIKESIYAIPDSTYSWHLSFYPERLYAWRTDGLSGYKADYRIAYPYLDPQPITYVDLALVDISVDSVFYWSPSPGSPVILVLSASIVNRSDDTLQSLTLHYQEESFQFCDPGVYPAHFNDLIISPGDTAVVKLSTVVWADQIDEPFVRTFFVQHGNHHLDSNWTDNSFILDYLISNAEDPVRASVSVYPNPFKDFLQTSDVSDSMQMSLYDQTGRLVANGYNRLDNLGKLPAGIYVLQIFKGHAIDVKRVIKVE